MSVVKAHTDAVSEVHFHEQQPDHMFSCSQSGDVWHWNGSNVAKNSSTTSGVFKYVFYISIYFNPIQAAIKFRMIAYFNTEISKVVSDFWHMVHTT